MARRRSRANAGVPPGCSTGLIPRDYAAHPVGYYSFAPAMPDSEITPESEWAGLLAENRRTKSGLRDLREANLDVLRSLDQDGLGLCWAFSSTKAVMYLRALMNASKVRLSAWWVAGVIKGWRDQGGWGAASLQKIVEAGVPAESYCPSYKSSFDTAETRANAALHKVTEWWDGSEDPEKAQRQLVSLLLKRLPCVVDLNDMGHSMCAIDIEKLSPLTILYDNSWGTNGDPDGYYRGTGARARPDGLIVPRVTLPSP
jgi:Papain family cysteine protease